MAYGGSETRMKEVGVEGMSLKGVSYPSFLPLLPLFLAATEEQLCFLSTTKLFLSAGLEAAKQQWTETCEAMIQIKLEVDISQAFCQGGRTLTNIPAIEVEKRILVTAMALILSWC